VREALVNLFIHQEYGDARTVAQIEVMPGRTEFFNAGSALVSVEALAVVGKSQSRNPVISRALRLIGFAELAGSGLREVERAWWAARHRPPRIESSEAANTFNLALDWNVAEEEINELWHQRTGVKLTPLQARALLLADHPGGTNAAEIASALDVPYEDAIEIARYLRTQAVVREQDDRLYLPDHLKTVADEAQRGVTEAAPSDVTPIDC
jgi:predicted HTH transcriptional regulator